MATVATGVPMLQHPALSRLKRAGGLRTILIMMVLMALLPAMGLAVYHGLSQLHQAREEAKTAAANKALALAGDQRDITNTARQIIETLAATTVVRVIDPQGCTQLFSQLLERSGGGIANILAVSCTGDRIAEAVNDAGDFFPPEQNPLGQVTYANRPWFQEVMRTGKFYAGPFTMSPSGKPIMCIACPARSWDGVKAVVVACLTLDAVTNRIEGSPLPQGSVVGIVASSGQVLSRIPDPTHIAGSKVSDTPTFQTVRSRHDGNADISGLDGVPRLIGFTTLLPDYPDSPTLYVGIPLAEAYAKAQAMLRIQILWLVLVGVVGIGAAWITGSRLLIRPITALMEASEAIGRGESATRLTETASVAELGRLTRAFNSMAEELEVRERGLVQLTSDLRNSNRDLEQFAYIASHDLQEPLRKVISFADLLTKRYSGQLDETGQRYINYMVDGARRMSRLISHLLEYSRIGTRGKSFATMELGEALDIALDNLQLTIESTGAIIHRPEALPTVTADIAQIGQLFQNLIGNALKYRHEDVTPEITIAAKRAENAWEIAIADNGIGIAPQHFERVFRMFQRLQTAKDYSGSGIGLSFCKRIVERHGGHIWVESEEGKGSTFFFTVPDREEGEPDA